MSIRELVIESFPACLDSFLGCVDQMLGSSRLLLPYMEAAPVFRFGALPDQCDEAYNFGLQLINMGAFQLPADTCWFLFQPFQGSGQDLAMFCFGQDDTVVAKTFCASPDIRNPRAADIVCTSIIKRQFTKESVLTGSKWEVLNTPKAHEDPHFGKLIVENSGYAANDLTFMIGLLNVKGVERRTTPAPVKLNKKRTAKGKPAISDVIEIRIPYAHSAAHGPGDRDSPRPHFRRGHVRRRFGRLIKVRPTFVMAEAPIKNYVIKMG